MFMTEQELETAFHAAYPQHTKGDVTNESSTDWADWFDCQARAGNVHWSLFEDDEL